VLLLLRVILILGQVSAIFYYCYYECSRYLLWRVILILGQHRVPGWLDAKILSGAFWPQQSADKIIMHPARHLAALSLSRSLAFSRSLSPSPSSKVASFAVKAWTPPDDPPRRPLPPPPLSPRFSTQQRIQQHLDAYSSYYSLLKKPRALQWRPVRPTARCKRALARCKRALKRTKALQKCPGAPQKSPSAL